MRQGDYSQKTANLARQTEELAQERARVQKLLEVQTTLDADPDRARRFSELWDRSQQPEEESSYYTDPEIGELKKSLQADLARARADTDRLRQETTQQLAMLRGDQYINEGLKTAQAAAQELGLPWSEDVATQVVNDLRALPISDAQGLPDMKALLIARNFDTILATEREKAKADYARGKGLEERGRPLGTGLGSVSPPPPAKAGPRTQEEASQAAADFLMEHLSQG